MTEKYYSVIDSRKYFVTEDTISFKEDCMTITSEFDEEFYERITKSCIRYEPKQYLFVIGYLKKLYYAIKYDRMDRENA